MSNNEKTFDVPVCLFLYRRKDTLLKTISILNSIGVKKVYLMGDYNEEHRDEIMDVRRSVKEAIKGAELICDFATENRGVFKNIGLGALRVFEKEEQCIFLEDDNLPDVSFFFYCRELLKKYRDNDRVLWVCGTDYLPIFDSPNNESYVFTQQLLPCGWASWRNKFTKFYLTNLDFLGDKKQRLELKKRYVSKKLWKQQVCEDAYSEYERFAHGLNYISWDYHMIMTIMKYDLLGIAPTKNLIRNTGIDELATHGGRAAKNVMAARFCKMDSFSLDFPLIHPKDLAVNLDFERRISKLRLKPRWPIIKQIIKDWIKEQVFHVSKYEPIRKKK
jgi:hypothetical protein